MTKAGFPCFGFGEGRVLRSGLSFNVSNLTTEIKIFRRVDQQLQAKIRLISRRHLRAQVNIPS